MAYKNDRENYSFDSPRSQEFSIPSNIVYYMNQNPVSPKCTEKLQQTCKHFFAKNAIVIVKDGYFSKIRWPNYGIFYDIQKLKYFYAKFWFTEKLNLWEGYQKQAKIICSKIYRCDINYLHILEKNLNFQDYKILTGSKKVKTVYLVRTAIVDDHENDIPLDLILNQTPQVTEFIQAKPSATSQKTLITNQTLENITCILAPNSVICFEIFRYILSPTVNFSLLSSFIKKCAAPKAIFRFSFEYTVPEQEIQFKEAISQMVSGWNMDKAKPSILIQDKLF